jgi:hypothetical protein
VLSDGSPASGVSVSTAWSFGETEGDVPVPWGPVGEADADGNFAIDPRTADAPTSLFAADWARNLGAIMVAREEGGPQEITATLEPLKRVYGRIKVSVPGGKSPSVKIWACDSRTRWMVARAPGSTEGFAFRLPAGSYDLRYSRDDDDRDGLRTYQLQVPVVIDEEANEFDLGDLELELTQLVPFEGIVTGIDGKPVSACGVATMWIADSQSQLDDLGWMKKFGGTRTDAEGRFVLNEELYDPSKEVVLAAFDARQGLGGLLRLVPAELPEKLVVSLEPVVEVRGRLTLRGEDAVPDWGMASVYVPGGPRFARCVTLESRFAFRLPPGAYRLNAYGADTEQRDIEVELDGSEAVVDLGDVDLEPTAMYRLRGRSAPEWNVTAARGLHQGTKIADFRGKWLLIEFWGFW